MKIEIPFSFWNETIWKIAKTTFIMPFGSFCYTTMMFGLQNAGAT
jgi:hypothetical protein